MSLKLFWKEKIAEPWDELQEKVRTQWSSLAPRERLILSVLASLFVVLLSILLIKEAFTFFSRHEMRAESDFQNVAEIQKLSSELANQRADLSRYESLRRKRTEPFQINQFIETQARDFNVSLEKISPAKPRGDSDEDWVEVRLGKNTTLSSALRFLRSVEEPIGVRLVDLEIKPQFADITKLDVVAVFAIKQEL
jgi:type II secretory pathway component PulM